MVEPRTNGAHGTADHDRDLFVRQVVAISQQKNLSLRWRNGGECRDERCLADIEPERLVRIVACAEVVHGEIVEPLELTSSAAQDIECSVAGCLEQPGAKRRGIREAGDPLEHREPHVLLNVIRIVSDQTSQIAQCLLAELVEQRGERLLVARLAAQHRKLQAQRIDTLSCSVTVVGHANEVRATKEETADAAD